MSISSIAGVTASFIGIGGKASREAPSRTEHDVSALQVPTWLAEFGKDATVSLGESGEAVEARNAKFDRLTAGEQDEYANLLQRHYVELLRDSGVQSTQQHFELIRDKQRSDELCLDLGKRIAGDSRLVELMAKLGLRKA